jgi:signal peptidase II
VALSDPPTSHRLAFATAVFALGLGLDQWTKQWAFTNLREGRPKVIHEGLFVLDYAFNPGSAFGMFADDPRAHTVVILTTVLALAYIAVLIKRLPAKPRSPRAAYTGTLALALMAAGALGNLLDRLLRIDEVRVRLGEDLPFWLLVEQPVAFTEALARGRNYVDVPRPGVVDFLVIYYWPGMRWPSFNLADVYLVVGVAMLLLYLVRQGKLLEEAPDTV